MDHGFFSGFCIEMWDPKLSFRRFPSEDVWDTQFPIYYCLSWCVQSLFFSQKFRLTLNTWKSLSKLACLVQKHKKLPMLKFAFTPPNQGPCQELISYILAKLSNLDYVKKWKSNK